MRRSNIVLAAAIGVWAALLPAQARAQGGPSPSPLQVEPLESGFLVAPDAKFTKVNDEFATLGGVYGGWSIDRTLLFGAGVYWLANRADDFKMQYAGGLVRWNIGGRRRVGLSTGALIGAGDATLSRTYGEVFGLPSGGPVVQSRIGGAGRGRRDVWRTTASDTRVRIGDDFFIAEPQIGALWNVSRWMRIEAGVGYRFIGASELLGAQLRGASGSIALQFGGR